MAESLKNGEAAIGCVPNAVPLKRGVMYELESLGDKEFRLGGSH